MPIDSEIPAGDRSGADSEPDRLEPPVAEIRVRPADPGRAASFERELSIGPVLAGVLAARGFESADEVRSFLAAEGSFDVAGIGASEAGGFLAAAIRDGRTIAVHGDYDCDGVCSTAILTLGLRALGARVVPRVPERADGYGLSVGAIDDLRSSGAEILIAVDCGVTAVDEVAHAVSSGMQVVVVDHHRFRDDGALPEALLVHPQRSHAEALPMCAAALALAVVEATGSSAGVVSSDFGGLELAGLATITDLMPLREANRSLVRAALEAFATTRNLGLSALIDAAGIDRTSIDARTLGFSLGPRINAAGRVRAAAAALELLLCEDRSRAERLAEELCAANVERREIQQQALFDAERQAAEQAASAGWVLAGEGWHKGVVGIVAGSIANRFHRPTIALAVEGDVATGSARSVPGYDVAAAISACSDLLLRHGGHSAAAGLTIASERIDEFRNRFAEVVDRTLPEELRVPTLEADLAVGPAELTLGVAEELAAIEPTGEGNPPVALAVAPAEVADVRPMGDGRHARFRLSQGSERAAGVIFNRQERVPGGLSPRMFVVGSLEINRWNGSESPRFNLSAASSIAGTPPIDVDPRSYSERVFAAHAAVERGLEPGDLSIVGAHLPAGGSHEGRLSRAANVPGLVFVVADLGRRSEWLRERLGACRVVEWSSLATLPDLLDGVEAVGLIDPPAASTGSGPVSALPEGSVLPLWTLGGIRFAMKLNDAETILEPHIRSFYSDIREAMSKGTDALELAMRGTGPHPRPVNQAAGMLSVLAEIGAIEVDPVSMKVQLSDPVMGLEGSRILARLIEVGEHGRRILGPLAGSGV